MTHLLELPSETREKLINQLKRHEGFRADPYKDSLGYLTVGYGHRLKATAPFSLTEAEASNLLWQDLDRTIEGLHKTEPGPLIRSLINDIRKCSLYNVAFQLGVTGLLGFRNMFYWLTFNDWEGAAVEMINSRWAKQTPHRAIELAIQMATGRWGPDDA